MSNNFYLPLMDDNITREDVNSVIDFLSQDQIPKLTNGPKVVEFENQCKNTQLDQEILFQNAL